MDMLSQLIDLHKNNLNELYRKRSITRWVSGDITSEDLVQTLNEYDTEVGILLYTYAFQIAGANHVLMSL